MVGDGLVLEVYEVGERAEVNLISGRIYHRHGVLPHWVLHVHRTINDDLGERHSESSIIWSVVPADAILQPSYEVIGSSSGIIVVYVTTIVDIAVRVELCS